MYEMFMGPFEDQTSWSDERLNGISRFLHKVWTLAGDLLVNSKQASLDGGTSGELDALVDRLSHKTIKKITQDIENMSFNTMVSTLMEYVNGLSQAEVRAALQLPEHADLAQRTLKTLILLMAPITPHMSEELWSMTGATNSTQAALWPKYDPELIKESLANIIIQVNGKFRATIVMPVDAREQDIIDTAKNNEHVKKYLDTGEIVKTIVVPQKLINFVIES
jgi:leucyl-tRNA synthetase